MEPAIRIFTGIFSAKALMLCLKVLICDFLGFLQSFGRTVDSGRLLLGGMGPRIRATPEAKHSGHDSGAAPRCLQSGHPALRPGSQGASSQLN